MAARPPLRAAGLREPRYTATVVLSKASALPRGTTSTGEVAISIRFSLAALSETRPSWASGREPTTSRSELLARSAQLGAE